MALSHLHYFLIRYAAFINLQGASVKRFTSKTLLISIAALLIMLALPVGALADAGEGENVFTQVVNGYQVTLVFDKPAAVGENQIHIQLKDAKNSPVANAAMEVSLEKVDIEHTGHSEADAAASAHSAMPGMADMPGMSAQPANRPSVEHDSMVMTTLESGHASGEYAGAITIGNPGNCVLRVHLTLNGELTQIDFPLTVAQPQNGSGILAAFFAVNVAIVSAAIVKKPKSLPVTLSKEA
jgi:hypothetical protein